MGIDSAEAQHASLLPENERQVADLSHPVDLGHRFDLVQCLEVAEHLPGSAADSLVASLARHADLILFSAAPPGQGGLHHINEQPYDYWRKKFSACGYEPYDWVRPRIAADADVAPWYRYNICLYANDRGADALTAELRAARIPQGSAITDLAPWPVRMQRLFIRMLPRRIVDALAMARNRS